MIVVLATHNIHKREELLTVLQSELGDGIILKTLDEITPLIGEIEETGTTLIENALIKARTVHERTSLPVIADDTGLEVEALGGAPGVYSARYAGEKVTYADNVNKLLSELGTEQNRGARFRTVIAYIDSDRKEHLFEGIVDGIITQDQRGTAGFGYDPIFQPLEDASGRTFAEMAAEEKNRISHRGRAVQELVKYLKTAL